MTFVILLAVSLLAVAAVSPRQMRALRDEGVAVSAVVTAVPNVVITVMAVAVGALLTPAVGLEAPFVDAIAGRAPLLPAAQAQLWAGIGFGSIAAGGVLVLYYGVFRRRLSPGEVLRMERTRLRLGLLARVLQGGVVEEIIFRWGAVTFFAWLAGSVLGGVSPLAMWSGIVLAGVLFGLAHLPGATILGLRLTPPLIGTALVVNLWAALVFGWLFWQYGLLAAVTAHATVHVLWFPLDHALYHRLAARAEPTQGREGHGAEGVIAADG